MELSAGVTLFDHLLVSPVTLELYRTSLLLPETSPSGGSSFLSSQGLNIGASVRARLCACARTRGSPRFDDRNGPNREPKGGFGFDRQSRPKAHKTSTAAGGGYF